MSINKCLSLIIKCNSNSIFTIIVFGNESFGTASSSCVRFGRFFVCLSLDVLYRSEKRGKRKADYEDQILAQTQTQVMNDTESDTLLLVWP